MKKLHERQIEEERQRKALESLKADKSPEERAEYCKHLQFVEHEPLFVMQYTTLFKSASQNDLLGIKHFLEVKTFLGSKF